MSGLHADTGAMNVNGKDTVANSEYFGNERASLRNNIEGLMGLWRGLSANEFNKSYETQDHNLEAFQQLLNDLGVAISKSANILNQTEEDNANAGAHLF
jgi:WXG100 family type VII secretion target